VSGPAPGSSTPPILSVVVPVLNEDEHLPRLLERLLEPGREARDRADEVLIVDGGSRDASASLARAAGARVIPSPPGRGLQLARGAESAAGEILLFLHADCVPGEDALEALREAFEQPGVELVAMRQRIEADHGFYRLVERAANARARRGMIYGDSGLALRSGLYRESGGFKPMRLFEDAEFSRRLARRARVRWLAEAELRISARRWQREGALRCTLRNWILRLLYAFGVSPERLARHYSDGSVSAKGSQAGKGA
jgi:rSAM/selenodomain-associated transferase 2